ncbi:pyridoxal phosphate-dependent transferase [Russula emetica]|nr:pyridoxal phosphate-dependent transferase [Russula emetica]
MREGGKELIFPLTERNIRWHLPGPSLSLSASTSRTISGVTITDTAITPAITPTPPPVDFTSNNYHSLSTSPLLRARFLSALHSSPAILGSGGSRVIVYNHAHAMLEARLARTFRSPAALLFNSGFDANAAFFACVPQSGDALLYDEAIHPSVHDGARASRIAAHMRRSFVHNDVRALRTALCALRDEYATLKDGKSSVFVAVESVYSMDGTVAPLRAILDTMKEVFPAGNAYLVVDEAHATGLYGPGGRGMVAQLGLEDRVLAQLHTFSKALAASGAVLLTNTLIRDYLLNYARPLIYTTSLSNAATIAASCSFDLLEDGTAGKLAAQLLEHSKYLQVRLRASLSASSIPAHILSLPARQASTAQPPTAITPLLTPYARALSAHLLARGLNARSISWPTVPKGMDLVRVCLHAGNTRAEIDALVSASVAWAAGMAQAERAGLEGDQPRVEKSGGGMDANVGNFLRSNL